MPDLPAPQAPPIRSVACEGGARNWTKVIDTGFVAIQKFILLFT
jgi:hypothetical protein